MKESLKNINQVRELFKKDVYHVFFIINPVVEIIIFLWIKIFKIPNSNVILLRLRNNFSGILNFGSTYFKKTILDRFFLKLGYDRNSKKYEKFVRSKSVKFYLYSSWVHPEFDFLLKNENCLGHFYIEEGQLAHRKTKFIENNNYHLDSTKRKNGYAEDLDSYHRSDAIKYISIDPKAFPHINTQEKILLEDFGPILNTYKPKLLGKKNIGIGPAPRRLNSQKLIDSMIILAKQMPDNSIIKLHPGFELRTRKLDLLKEEIQEKTNKTFEFCDQSVLLEIEMIFEKKHLYGAKSSLIRYASLFGSDYQVLDLYKK